MRATWSPRRLIISLALIVTAAFPATTNAVSILDPNGITTDGTPQFTWYTDPDEISLGIETSASPVLSQTICQPSPPPGCFADSTYPAHRFFKVFPDDNLYQVHDEDEYAPGTYYWHILMTREGNSARYFSSIGSFTVPLPPEEKPAKIKKAQVKYYSCSRDILYDIRISNGAPAKWRLDFLKGRHGRSVFHYDGRVKNGSDPFHTGNAPRELKVGKTYFTRVKLESAGVNDKSKPKRLKIGGC